MSSVMPHDDRRGAVHHYRDRDDGPIASGANLGGRSLGNGLIDSLMRASAIDVQHRLSQSMATMAVVQDQAMITAVPADTTQEVLTDGSGPRSDVRSAEDLNPTGRRDASKLSAVRAVMVTAQRAWSNAKGCRLTQVLRDPLIRWMPGPADVDNGP